jgi:glycerate kinase
VLAALSAAPSELIVALGGSATVDGGAGLREVVRELPVPTTVLCDVLTPLAEAARLFGPQKGASPEDVAVLERRLREDAQLRPYADLPGAGAAGGLGAALASLGARLAPGAAAVLDLIGFDERLAFADLVVTGEGQVDPTTSEGKAPAEVARRAALAGVRCVVFGGRVLEPLPGAETVALSGDPARAAEDLVELGVRLVGR